jgi:hypothetical protein
MRSLFAFILGFEEDDEDPRYSIPQAVSGDAVEDLVVKIDPVAADRHGIDLDGDGFPISESLEAWHRKNNPHLFG